MAIRRSGGRIREQPKVPSHYASGALIICIMRQLGWLVAAKGYSDVAL